MEPLRYEMDLPLERDAVWDAWTTSGGVSAWWCAHASVDPVVGGRYVLWGDCDGADSGSLPALDLRVMTIDRPRLLVLGCEGASGVTGGTRDREAARTRLDVTLYPSPDGTRIEIVHSGFGESADALWVRRRFEPYWWGALEGLRAALGT
jgi:uncharacterized protein YndB with AHSA1/START domain